MTIIEQLQTAHDAEVNKAKARYLAILGNVEKANPSELTALLNTLGYSLAQCQTHAAVIAEVARLSSVADQYQVREDAYVQAEKEMATTRARHASELGSDICKWQNAMALVQVSTNARNNIAELKAKHTQLF